MTNKILHHPIFSLADDISQICKPLRILNISYFSHVCIDHESNFTGIGNGPAFTENYFKKKYYNADIHLLKNLYLGKYIVWDDFELVGNSAKMYEEGFHFGVKHVFTIVGPKNVMGQHYFHFGTNESSPSVNLKYLSNIDLLELFIAKFQYSVNQSKFLSKAYSIKFNIRHYSEYTLNNEKVLKNNNDRYEFLNMMKPFSPHEIYNENISFKNYHNLPFQQLRCLRLLIQGKSAKQIACELNLSQRTVENYLLIIRKKMKCRNQLELIYGLNNNNQISR